MARFKLVAMSNPNPGREEECGRWYDSTHLRDMVSVPGILSAQRFELLRSAPSTAFKRYLAIYEVEAADEAEAKSIITRLNEANLPLAASLDVPSVNLAVFKAAAAPTEALNCLYG